MTSWNFKVNNWHTDIIENFPRKPSKCDAVLKCSDGQIHLPAILLAISSTFWKNLLSELDSQLETVILIPEFNKDTIHGILHLLQRGELKTDFCPRVVQEIINFTQIFIPDIDIFTFEVEAILKSESSNEETSESESDQDNEFEGVEVGKTKEARHARKRNGNRVD